MSMPLDTIAEAVCRMARDFYRLGNVSMIGLLESSGYLSCPGVVAEELLERAFAGQPELIDAWVVESQNKRTSEGWYIRGIEESPGGAIWEVGYHPHGARRTFSNRARACAFYVKADVEHLRSIIEKRHP